MDFFELLSTVSCLNKVLSGAQIKSCGQVDHKCLGLHLRSQSMDTVLLMDLKSASSGLFLSEQRLPASSQTLLARSFKNKLAGAYIENVSMPYPDRYVVLTMRMAEWQQSRMLWIEFSGNRSNIVLVEQKTQKILECLSNFPDDLPLHPLRMPGRLFESPWNRIKRQSIIALAELATDGYQWNTRHDEKTAFRWLLHNVFPMTPELASRLVQSTHGPEKRSIVKEALETLSSINRDSCNHETALLHLKQAASHKAQKSDYSSLERQRQELVNILKQALKRCKRTIKAVERDQEKLPDPERIRQLADSVAAEFHRLKQGMNSITVRDVHSENSAEIVVALDPALNPGLNLERLYKRAGKASRARPRIVHRLKELRLEYCALEEELDRVRSSTEPKELAAIREQLVQAGFFERGKTRTNRQAMLSRQPFLRVVSSEGFAIRVGRSARENDLLTFRHSSPMDFWLHAQGYHGAHVIVRNPNKIKTLPDATCQLAAAYAVYYSKARGENAVPVYLTHRKYVRKAPGNIPGLAVVTRHETLTVDSMDIFQNKTKTK